MGHRGGVEPGRVLGGGRPRKLASRTRSSAILRITSSLSSSCCCGSRPCEAQGRSEGKGEGESEGEGEGGVRMGACEGEGGDKGARVAVSGWQCEKPVSAKGVHLRSRRPATHRVTTPTTSETVGQPRLERRRHLRRGCPFGYSGLTPQLLGGSLHLGELRPPPAAQTPLPRLFHAVMVLCERLRLAVVKRLCARHTGSHARSCRVAREHGSRRCRSTHRRRCPVEAGSS